MVRILLKQARTRVSLYVIKATYAVDLDLVDYYYILIRVHIILDVYKIYMIVNKHHLIQKLLEEGRRRHEVTNDHDIR